MGSSLVSTIAVFKEENGDVAVLLCRRKKDPKRGKWSLPGGHADEGETPEATARRELEEETGIKAGSLTHVVDARTDPRRGLVDALFATVVSPNVKVRAGDDAAAVRWVKVQDVPEDLAFDHYHYVISAFHRLFGDQRTLGQLVARDKRLTASEEVPQKGLLIVFEGVDGVGKTTQVKDLVDWLDGLGYNVVTTKWNSSKLLSDSIDKAKKKRLLTPALYSLLHAADMLLRYEHDVRPALDADEIVVCDRYGPYTSGVRDKVRGVDVAILGEVYKGLRQPDIIFHCVAPAEVAFSRLLGDKGLSYYGAGMDLNLSSNKEENCLKYQQEMDKTYKEILPSKSGYHELDTKRPVNEIAKEVRKVLHSKFGIGRFKIARKEDNMIKGLRFASEDAALQYLADVTRNRVIIQSQLEQRRQHVLTAAAKGTLEDVIIHGTFPEFVEAVKKTKGGWHRTREQQTKMVKKQEHSVEEVEKGGVRPTPLHVAALNGKADVAEYLIKELKADVNAVDDFNATPLHNAALAGDKRIAELLVSHGSDPNAIDNSHETPWFLAAKNDHADVLRYLIGHGADLRVLQTKRFKTALSLLSETSPCFKIIEEKVQGTVSEKKPSEEMLRKEEKIQQQALEQVRRRRDLRRQEQSDKLKQEKEEPVSPQQVASY